MSQDKIDENDQMLQMFLRYNSHQYIVMRKFINEQEREIMQKPRLKKLNSMFSESLLDLKWGVKKYPFFTFLFCQCLVVDIEFVTF